MKQALKNATLWTRSLADPGTATYEFPIALYFENLITQGRHQQLIEASSRKIFKPSLSAIFYKAKSQYLRGNFQDAQTLLEPLLDRKKAPDEVCYLLAKVLYKQDNRHAARKLLLQLSGTSRRVKTWIQLSNLTRTKEELAELKLSLVRATLEERVKLPNKETARILANASFRANAPQEAINAWKEYAKGISGHPTRPMKIFRRPLITSDHRQALIDLKCVLNKNSTEFFLISGTLLGAIREDRILPHDNDIDVGIWAKDWNRALHEVITTSGLFEEIPNRSKNLLKIRHTNGSAIDIFKHTTDGIHCHHEGVKIRWTNKLFNLKSHKFLGNYFMIPSNPEEYLTENYGNWQQPIKDFDSAIDTPNSTIINRHEIIAYLYSKLDDSRNQQKYERLLRDLIQPSNNRQQ